MSLTRVRALAVVGILLAGAIVMVFITLNKDSQKHAVAQAGCKGDEVQASVALPEPKFIKINVFNTTDAAGLASSVGDNLRNRKFQVLKVSNDPARKRIDGVGALRFGPKSIGAAWLLKAYFLNDESLKLEFDINRDDDIVDVVLGSGFRDLATVTEVNQSVAAEGDPDMTEFPGTCVAKS